MTTAEAMQDKSLFGHPRGLVNLFFTELWERFSYYGMRAILVLYMVAAVKDGGLGMTMAAASSIYGIYTMCVYLTSLPGGFIADRFIGQRKAVLYGGLIIAVGQFCMAVPMLPFFYMGMATIVIGTGLLKPNISTMLGMLYKEGDPRRDAGFSIFYMGINIGAALSPLVVGFLAQSQEFKNFLVSINMPTQASWQWGFGAGGIGMLIGLAHYVIQGRLLGDAGKHPTSKPTTNDAGEKTPAEKLSPEEVKRLGAVAVLFFFNMLFWAIYEQGGSSLNVFADRCTNCEMFGWQFPSSWLQFFQAAFVIILAPVISYVWIKLGDKQPSAPAKFTIGLAMLGLGIVLMVPASMLAAQGKVSPLWLIFVYLLEVVGELCLSPVGLSTVTKLAPARMVALTMGAWFISIACGNYIAGYLSGFFDDKDVNKMSTLFGSMAVAAFVGTTLLAVLTPKVKKLMGSIR